MYHEFNASSETNISDSVINVSSDDSTLEQTSAEPFTVNDSKAEDPDWNPNAHHLNSDSATDEETLNDQETHGGRRELRPRKNGKTTEPTK